VPKPFLESTNFIACHQIPGTSWNLKVQYYVQKSKQLISKLSQINPGHIPILFLYDRSPLWSSGQSSSLQIGRPGFDSRHYQKKKVVGLEWGPLSVVRTTEELLDRKVAAPV
jgi:hypothetical protein